MLRTIACVAVLISLASSAAAQPVGPHNLQRIAHNSEMKGDGTTTSPLGLITTCSTGKTLTWNGAAWVCSSAAADVGTGTANTTTKWTGTSTLGNGWALDDGTSWGVSGKFLITEATGATTVSGAFAGSSTGSFGGALNMNSNKITSLTDGSSSADAAAFHQIADAVNTAVTGTSTDLAIYSSAHVLGNYAGSSPSACTTGQAVTTSALSAAGALTASCTTLVSGTNNTTAKFTGANTFGNAWALDDGTSWGVSGKFLITEASGATTITGLATLTAGATTPANYTTTGSGSLVVGGTGTASVAGLSTLTGGATTPANYTTTGSGSLVIGGTGTASIAGLTTATGGITTPANYTTTGSGSLVVGGTGTASVAGLSTLTGGFTLGADSSANSHKITSLTNGSSAQDAAAFGQIATAVNAAVAGTSNVVQKSNGSHALADSLATDDGSVFTIAGKFKTTLASSSTTYGNDIVQWTLANTDTTTNNWESLIFMTGTHVAASIDVQNVDTTNFYGDINFSTRAADGYLRRLYIRSDGNVDIGATTAIAKFGVDGASSSGGPGSTDKGIAYVNAANNSVGLSIGNYSGSPFGMWLQAMDIRSGQTGTYPLILQPTGGIVGIGTTSPSATLTIVGSETVSTTLGVTGLSTLTGGFNASKPSTAGVVTSAATAQGIAMTYSMSGTNDTTSGSFATYASVSTNSSTRSAGSNALTNVAGYFNASGAQVNEALHTDNGNINLGAASGTFENHGAATFDSTVATGAITIAGNKANTGTKPTITSGCGTVSPSITGGATSGIITTTAGAASCDLTFAAALTGTPSCIVEDDTGLIIPAKTVSTTDLIITVVATHVYSFDCWGH